MSAGDNTLNSVTSLEMLKTMQRVDPNLTQSDQIVRGAVLRDYVRFMTTPGILVYFMYVNKKKLGSCKGNCWAFLTLAQN